MQSQPQYLDLYRASLRSAADIMKMSLEQAERVQQRQLQIVRSALEENERSSSQIAEAKSLDDIFTVNSRLAGAQLERVAHFWSTVWQAAGETQKLVLDQMQSEIGEATKRVREGYDFTARTSEEAARIAAAQMTKAATQAREAVAASAERATQERKAQEVRKTG